MAKKKKSGKKKGTTSVPPKKGTHGQPDEEDVKKVPRSFVINRGQLGSDGERLMMDMRRVMSPYTALKLKVRKSNVLKDFVHVAGPLGVTHLLVFNRTEVGLNLRIARLPRGPTLTFRIAKYAHAADVLRSLKNPKSPDEQFMHPPLLVMNNVAQDKVHLKLVTSVFQNMFPAINVDEIRLREIRRVLLLHHNTDTDEMELRHYDIGVAPVGMSSRVKKLVRNKRAVPDLSKFQDVSDFVLNAAGDGNDSDAEEMVGEANSVVLPQNMGGAGNVSSQKSAVKLTELGPRINMSLIKVEEGFCGGDVLFHKFVQKTPGEVKEIKKRLEKERQLKAMRKAQQEKNVQRKKEAKEEHRQRSIEGHKRKYNIQDGMDTGGDGSGDEDGDGGAAAAAAGDGDYDYEDAEEKLIGDIDDAEWYRREVGEEPDRDLGLHNKQYSARAPSTKFSKKVGDKMSKKRKADGEDGERSDGKEKRKKKEHHKADKTGDKGGKQHSSKAAKSAKSGSGKKKAKSSKKK